MIHYFRHSGSVSGSIFQGFSIILFNKYRFDIHVWKRDSYHMTYYNKHNHTYGIVLGQVYICGRLF